MTPWVVKAVCKTFRKLVKEKTANAKLPNETNETLKLYEGQNQAQANRNSKNNCLVRDRAKRMQQTKKKAHSLTTDTCH